MLFSATLLAVLVERSNAHSIAVKPYVPYSGVSVWSSWSGWGPCNHGHRYRTCTCISGNPIPCNYGTYLKDKVKCAVPAPTSRIWSAWSSWGNCLNGKRTRTASCLIPNSNYCRGVLEESSDCQVIIPQPTVIWSSWSSYGPCVRGKRVRTCNCLSPNPAVCQGVLEESGKCAMPEPTRIWSSWSSWGTCYNGKRVRTCDCISPNPAICQGILEERQTCGTVTLPPVNQEIWSSWSAWSTCNRGQRTRSANCISNNPSICQGALYESQNCAYVPVVVKRANCSVLTMYSLNACLNANSLCFSWWNRPSLHNAQACFSTWRYSAAQIGRFNRQFGSYLSR
jgi:hypothetical protein